MNHLGTKNIETDRLLLRKVKLDDANDFFEHFSDKTVEPFPHENVQQTVNFLETCMKQYENNDYYYWAIELKNINKIIGAICVINNNRLV